jgi:hypothetical protein
MIESILAVATDEWWIIVGTIAAIVAAVAVIFFGVYEFVILPKWRRKQLRTPCEAWFAIASANKRVVGYAIQNEHEHYVEELTLAAHSEFELEILYRSSIGFTASEIYFGCGDQNYCDLETKPIIESRCSHFVERGTKEENPDTHPATNAVDRHWYYHIKESKSLARDETFSLGCKIKTRQPGLYAFRINFASEEVGSTKNKLFIRVEDPPATKMRCVKPDHKGSHCFVQPLAIDT